MYIEIWGPPQIQGHLDLGIFDLTNFDPPSGEHFMGTNCNVTPQLKIFFLLQI